MIFDSVNREYDTTGWTVYEPVECTCIDAYTGSIKTSGGIKPVFILHLYSHELDRNIIKFFNCNITKTGNYTVNKNSDFARLYRLTIGENPVARYSKAKQLLGHMVCESYVCEYVESKDKNDQTYFKAKNIKPVVPKMHDDWFENGQLKRKRAGRKRSSSIKSKSEKSLETARIHIGNELESNRLESGNKLENKIPHEVRSSNTSDRVLTTLHHSTYQTNRVESSHHADDTQLSKDTNLNDSRVSTFHYHQDADESYDHYIDRVLDESIARW